VDSIAKIAHMANWDYLMGGGIDFNDVSVEEESEFNHYMVSLNLKEGTISIGNALVNYVSLGVKFEFTGLRPVIDPEVSDNLFQLKKYRVQNTELYAHYRHNTMDRVLFPTGGASL
jgi:hypothetical protein